ncbi:MAG: type IV pilus assembly protein PilM [Actinobacteria bacterium]|nr:type IV pilus assembly protein PilM [Actinomycetota bacterium]
MNIRQEIRLPDLGALLGRSGAAAPRRRRSSRRPERVVHRELVGLKVGASQIAAAQVVNDGSPELVRVGRERLRDGIVVGGEVKNPQALGVALGDFFARHELPTKSVRLGVANNRIGVRAFQIAGVVDETQLGNAIRFRAQELLPIPLEEAVLDYHVIGKTTDEAGQVMWRIVLVVAHRDLIDHYVQACDAAGLGLVGIDLEAFGLLRALAAPQDADPSGETSALVGVSLGHDRSTFAVSDGRVCEFARVLNWGGEMLTDAIAKAVPLPTLDAETAKRTLTLEDPTAVPDGLTVDQGSRAVEAVRAELRSFARELVSSLHFYQNQPASLPLGEIVLTGGTSQLPGLAGELERVVGVSVRIADPLARVQSAPALAEVDELGSLTVAIGLGIED